MICMQKMNVIAKISYFQRQRIYIYLTPDKKLNSLIYRMLFCVNIYGSYSVKKQSGFFGPPCT